MTIIVAWLHAAGAFASAHPELVYMLVSATIASLFKNVDRLPKPVKEGFAVLAALGIDAPKAIAIVVAWFGQKPPSAPSGDATPAAKTDPPKPSALQKIAASFRLRWMRVAMGAMIVGSTGFVAASVDTTVGAVGTVAALGITTEACIAPKTAVDTGKLAECVIVDVQVHNVTKPEQIALDCGEASAQVVYDLILDLINQTLAKELDGGAGAHPGDFILKLRAVQPPADAGVK